MPSTRYIVIDINAIFNGNVQAIKNIAAVCNVNGTGNQGIVICADIAINNEAINDTNMQLLDDANFIFIKLIFNNSNNNIVFNKFISSNTNNKNLNHKIHSYFDNPNGFIIARIHNEAVKF